MSSVRPMFATRGKTPSSKKKSKGKPKLSVVNPANSKSRKKNPTDSSIPWKTIIATTVVTSVVSTFAVTFARIILERARSRKELQALGMGHSQGQVIDTTARTANPAIAHHSEPALALPAPPHVPQSLPSSIPLVQNPSAAPVPGFQTNPFTPSQLQRGPLALPEAPHVPAANPTDSSEPRWFREFREDYERRIENVESRVRTERNKERDRY